MNSETVSAKTSLWTKTNTPNLYRHANKQYYARVRIGKNDVWKSLKTKVKSVAVHELAGVLEAAATQRHSGRLSSSGPMKVGELAVHYRTVIDRDTKLALNTKRNRLTGLKLLFDSWPELDFLSVRKISTVEVKHWFERLEREAKPYIPKGAKSAVARSTGKSATRLNGALDALRHLLDLAVDQGYLPVNPARQRGIKRVRPTKKTLVLPSREEFVRLVQAIRNRGRQKSWGAADMVYFLALTGARLEQAGDVCWKNVNWQARTLELPKSKRTPSRRVPIGEELFELLTRMHAGAVLLGEASPDKPVLRVKSCQGFLTVACKQLGIHRITHHDLRHLFATTAMESGVDVPTVAKLLGHADGGALAMKVYGHVREDHLKEAVARIRYDLSVSTSS